MMAVEIMIARQLTYYAARQRIPDGAATSKRDGETARRPHRWSNADNAVQIHGGNGFAMEFRSRASCARASVDLRGRGGNPGAGYRAGGCSTAPN